MIHHLPPTSSNFVRGIAGNLLLVMALGFAPGRQSAAIETGPRLVVLIGGINSDPTPQQLEGKAPRRVGNSGMYQLRGDFLAAGVEADYYNWNGSTAGNIKQKKPPHAAAIVDSIRVWRGKHSMGSVAIVGNSWGGHTALDVCQRLLDDPKIEIEVAVFLDPSSAGRPERIKVLPGNIRKAVNYFTGNAFGWKAWEGDARIENINLGDEKTGFMIDGKPNYAAPFDLQAHIAAEWDEKIHADIVKRVLVAYNRN